MVPKNKRREIAKTYNYWGEAEVLGGNECCIKPGRGRKGCSHQGGWGATIFVGELKS